MKRAISFFTQVCESYLPDAFVFSLVLTLFVFLAALTFTGHSPLNLVDFWARDFWDLNAFAMQMVFVLLSGHMLATTPVLRRALGAMSSRVKSEASALVLLSFFSVTACFLNWGFGLIVSGILAVEMARRLGRVNFGLFIATAYAGFVVWHGGLSGSIPLKIAGTDEILTRVHPGLSVPLSETIFTSQNLLLITLILVAIPILALVMRTEEKTVLPSAEGIAPETPSLEKSVRSTLENSRLLVLVFFLMFLVAVFRGGGLDINRVNFIFLFLAFLMHGTPARFLRALQSSVGFTSGIIIQFPFYAGIMGLMRHSGLVEIVSSWFVSFSTKDTLPLFTFLSAGIVNFFVPSGGGQWVVQGPVMLQAAEALGVAPARIAMALAWGDAWTNLIQPFWALPLLAMAGLRLKDIMGYCLMYLLASGLLIGSVMFFF